MFTKRFQGKARNVGNVRFSGSNIIAFQNFVPAPENGAQKGKYSLKGSPSLPQRVPGRSRNHPRPAQQVSSQIEWDAVGRLASSTLA